MSIAKERQDPLIKKYAQNPSSATIVDTARTSGGTTEHPFHGTVLIGQPSSQKSFDFGIHRAIGGEGEPNPGDLLCGAIAACLDSAIRIIANRLGVGLDDLAVVVEGEVDVRGTLRVDESVPVGFQKLNVDIEIAPVEELNRALVKRLVRAAEKSCVNLQTLFNSTAVSTKISVARVDEFETAERIPVDPMCTSQVI